MEASSDASPNLGNSPAIAPSMRSADYAGQFQGNRDAETVDTAGGVHVKGDVDGEGLPTLACVLHGGYHRVSSENTVGSSSDPFQGHRQPRRSIVLSQGYAGTAPGISPMAMNSHWAANSLNQQLGTNQGQPSPPSSRRGSISFSSGSFAALDGPFPPYIPQRTSFSFASDLSAPVAAPGVSAAPLPSAASLDFPDDDPASLQSMFQMGSLHSHPMYSHGVPDLLPGYQLCRGSRGGESFDYLEPVSHPELSKLHAAHQISSQLPSAVSRSARGRGRPAKRSRGAAAADTFADKNLNEVGMDDLLPPVEIKPQAPPGQVLSTASSPIESQRRRRNSAVSLMLLGESSGPLHSSADIPMPEKLHKSKKRKYSDSDEDHENESLDSAHRLSEEIPGGDEDQDDDYVSEHELCSLKKAKTSHGTTARKAAATFTPTKTGASHWPILKMEPVILPRSQQQQLDASYSGDGDGDDDEKRGNWGTGRKKIRIEFIENKLKRQITFSKRKSGMMKKIHELTTLTGTEALLVLVSETGHIYSYATSRTLSLVEEPEVNPVKMALEAYVRFLAWLCSDS